MTNQRQVRGLDINIKKRKTRITFKKIGHSSEQTNERLLKIYKRFDEIRHGKSEQELLNQANNPKSSS